MRTIIAALLFAATLFPQAAKQANEGYRTKEGRERVAKVLSGPNRDARQKPVELVGAMQLREGQVVADLGTGVGYMLPYLSKAVGPSGRVLAQDIHEDFLDAARKKAESEKLANVEFITGTEKDPRLPENGVDVVLALDAYHHFDYPTEMLASIRKALRPGGRFVLVEFYKKTFAGDPDHIRLEDVDMIKEIESNGFRLLSRRDHVPGSQYMAVFEEH